MSVTFDTGGAPSVQHLQHVYLCVINPTTTTQVSEETVCLKAEAVNEVEADRDHATPAEETRGGGGGGGWGGGGGGGGGGGAVEMKTSKPGKSDERGGRLASETVKRR